MGMKNSPCFSAVLLSSLWVLLLDPEFQLAPETSDKLLDPDVLKQYLEAALIPFMQLLFKLFYGIIIFLHLTHWSAPWPFG